ncbi:sporulation protein YtxC [Alkalihalobacillus sp. CinArs1]|uniref:sporulation protein YtxC n=1 Tax=Alkalihalobacillus sp. CinArs1 TaxID=2995314 RepID=UPI0022DD636B|nr:sporulation protein YtxC [Alkalihalobacillus sp. CinArs1]
MVSLTFKNKADYDVLHAALCLRGKETLENEAEMVLSIPIEPYDSRTCFEIADCLAHCVKTTYEKVWMQNILRTSYYFKDREEIDEICGLARSIGDGDRIDVPRTEGYRERFTILRDAAFGCIEQGGTISFDSFLVFRTRPYQKLLSALVAEAIDEYKLEQEYQNFIEALRQLLQLRNPKQKEVNLLFDGEYHLVDEKGVKLVVDSMDMYFEELPNELTTDEIDPDILLPLLYLAPEEINVFTDDIEEGLTQTIRNVFQERLRFFPFHMSKIFFSGNH